MYIYVYETTCSLWEHTVLLSDITLGPWALVGLKMEGLGRKHDGSGPNDIDLEFVLKVCF